MDTTRCPSRRSPTISASRGDKRSAPGKLAGGFGAPLPAKPSLARSAAIRSNPFSRRWTRPGGGFSRRGHRCFRLDHPQCRGRRTHRGPHRQQPQYRRDALAIGVEHRPLEGNRGAAHRTRPITNVVPIAGVLFFRYPGRHLSGTQRLSGIAADEFGQRRVGVGTDAGGVDDEDTIGHCLEERMQRQGDIGGGTSLRRHAACLSDMAHVVPVCLPVFSTSASP